jgi:ectoine hydroxylase-related dioxygenase (phytanoyl-CoA dioxygenase family)
MAEGFAMNRNLLNPVTAEQIEAYDRDGVVLIRGAFDQDWIRLLLDAWTRMRAAVVADPSSVYRLPESFLAADPDLAREIAAIRSEDAAQQKMYTQQAPGFTRCKYMRWWSPEFRQFALESPAGELIGNVIGARTVRFFLDAMFMKEPGTAKTYWHADQPAWPTAGEQVPTMWMPLLPVRKEVSSLEFIAGTQHDRAPAWPNTYNAKLLGHPPGRPKFIDYEARRGDPAVRFLAYDMEPGDVLIIHSRTYHGGGANQHPTQPRIALSTRWFGDDVTWDPQPECINIPGMPRQAMRRGDPPSDEEVFPVVWRRAAAAAPRVRAQA